MFNKKDVRREFVSKYCHEYELPSGKRSGSYAFPISIAEINELTKEYSDSEFSRKGDIKTVSEWRLFIALRKKYGFSYLETTVFGKYKQEPVHDYVEPEETVEDKIERYVEKRFFDHHQIYHCPKPEPEQIEENNFRDLLK